MLPTVKVVCIWLADELAFREQLAIKIGLQSVLLVDAVLRPMLQVVTSTDISTAAMRVGLPDIWHGGALEERSIKLT